MHRRLSIVALIFLAAIALAASGVIAAGLSGAAAADAGTGSQGEVSPKISRVITEAVNSPDRPADDKQLDAGRRPEQILTFFGIGPGMKVADIFAGRSTRGLHPMGLDPETALGRYMRAHVLQGGTFIVTGIVWLLWLHSSYGLLRYLGTKVTRFSPGWAVGCWFVPFVNLVRPYQVVEELRLRLSVATRRTIARALDLLGVSAPDAM